MLPNVVVQVVYTPSSYSERPGLKSGPRDRLFWGFSWLSSGPRGESRKSTSNHATTASFHALSNESFTYHPSIRRYIVLLETRR
jgi:hypothetical protein